MDKLLKFLIVLSMLAAMFLAAMRTADASDWSVKFGPGIANGSSTGATKMFGIRREEDIMDGIHYSFEGGGFVDNIGEGRRGSAFVKTQFGVKPGMGKGVFGKAFFGPAAISSPDSVLGSIPQFATDVGFGVSDELTGMGIGYSHISNAGLFSKINKGRDYIVFEVIFRL